MTQRSRDASRRRGGSRSKLLFVAAAVLALIAVARDRRHLLGARRRRRRPLALLLQAGRARAATRPSTPPTAASSGVVASDEARTPVALRAHPEGPAAATVAIEDQRFYEHGGIDPEAILRAAIKDLEAGEAVEGGSTITQQLVRNLCIPHPEQRPRTQDHRGEAGRTSTRSATRSAEILGQYLNTASYGTVEGSTAVGVQAASRIYFSRPVWKLDLAAAALLAGLPQAPTDYNPILNPAGARERRNEVLAKMAELGFVSERRGARRPSGRRPRPRRSTQGFFSHRQPYFFDYVEDKLIEDYGVNTVRRGGLDVYTTIDPRLQEVGLEAMRSALPYSNDPSSALVSIDPRNGEIRAMVSSSSYDSSQFNLAAQGHRQPGSTFKAFVLTTAIKQGIDPYSTYYTSKPLDLEPARWGHWDVHTADEGYLGRSTSSRRRSPPTTPSSPSSTSTSGPNAVAETAHSMGITSPLDGIPAEGIGGLRVGVSPLEMSDAYATLASGGIRHDPVAIRRVVFPGGKVDQPERPEPEAGDLRSGRLRGDAAPARQHHRRHRHGRLHRLRGPGRQDRHHRPLHRRLVRRLPAQPGDRGLGRLPANRTRSK